MHHGEYVHIAVQDFADIALVPLGEGVPLNAVSVFPNSYSKRLSGALTSGQWKSTAYIGDVTVLVPEGSTFTIQHSRIERAAYIASFWFFEGLVWALICTLLVGKELLGKRY